MTQTPSRRPPTAAPVPAEDEGYRARRARLSEQIRAADGEVRLGKATSNLFRDRARVPARRLDVRDFNHVLAVDADAGWVEVEGMTPYQDLVAATLPHGVMPAVVPQLKSITIGGAVSGVGIEASSFRYGLVHETVQAMDVLLADGEVVTCRPDNEHRDLFYGLPNSYGSLGYVLKLRALAVPVKPYVRLEHHHFESPQAFFEALGRHCEARAADFIDGVVFGPRSHVLTLGRFADSAPYTSDYHYEKIYYRSLLERDEDYLTVADYIWRWDTDWFWCSKNLYAQHPLVRRLLGPRRLNSVFYTKVMRFNSRWGITRRLNRLRGLDPESVIQDVDIPLARAPEFLDFFHREIGILPIWICPIHAWRRDARFTLYPMDPDRWYVNFGFWDVVRSRERHPPGHFNRKVEDKVGELGGIKSLYSDAYYDRETFWAIYNGPAYRRLKERYDPDGRLPDLYDKTVLRR